MRILRRYISKELVGPFFLGLGVFTFVMLMQQIIELTDLVIYKGVSMGIVVRLFLFVLPYFLMFTIPIAMLLGFITGLISLLSLQLGWVFGWSVWLVLQYIIWVLEKLASLNWAYYEFAKIN